MKVKLLQEVKEISQNALDVQIYLVYLHPETQTSWWLSW